MAKNKKLQEELQEEEYEESTTESNTYICIKCNCILDKANSKARNKKCNACIQEQRNKNKLDKTEDPNKIKCSKCHSYRSIESYLKQTKMCIDCRNNASGLRKIQNGNTENTKEANNNVNNSIKGITAKELYNYLINRFPDISSIPLEDIIEEITTQETDTESYTESEE
jgi:hypothetical protein